MKSGKRKKGVLIFTFCLVFILGIEINVAAQHTRRKWINFSPYTGTGQNPENNSPIPTSQIHKLLDSLVLYFEGIRIFGTLDPLDSIPYFAKQKGLKVIVGIWLGKEDNPAGKAANIAQINSGIAIANAGLADKIMVGSEVLYRGDLQADTLVKYIQQVKSACPNIAVSCADVYSSLMANPGVINACDFVAPNIYPFWEGVPIDCAMQRFHQIYLSLLPYANGKEIFISESGWKTSGNAVGAAVPSLPNAIRYNRGLLAWSQAMGKDVNLFIAYDEPWKQSKNDDGWGIFSNNAVLKPGMDTLFKPFTNIDSVWLCSKLNDPGNDTLSVDYVPFIGSNASIKGHVNNIVPCDFRIATYIKVGGGWWTKPFFHEPAVQILCDGKWNVNYATGGNDILATDICVFLVPSTFVPPLCSGCAIIPQDVYQNAIQWKCINRATITATLTASRDTICFGDSVTLTATGGTRYLWSTGDTSSSIVARPQLYTEYTVEISTNPGTGTILSKTISVNPAPVINSTPVSQTVCSGDAIKAINISSGATFNWTRDRTTNLTGIASNGTGATIAGTLTNATNAPQTTTFTITTTAGGCSSSTTAAVTVNPKPGVNAAPPIQTVCSGVTFDPINSANNTAGTTFSWTRDNTTILTGMSSNGTGATIAGALSNMTNTPLTTIFTIKATANGCADSTLAKITVNPLPTVGLIASPFTSLLPGQTTTLTATPGASKGGTITTLWLYNSSQIPVAGNSYVVDMEKIGLYQALIQESWPGNKVCTNQSPVVTIEAGVSDRLFIYPNPNSGLFTVSYYNPGSGSDRTVTVYDSKGAKKYNAKFNVQGPYTLLSVDLRPLQRGIYMVVVRDADGKKIVSGKVTIH